LLMLAPMALLLAGAWVSRRLWRSGSIVWLIILHKIAICAAFFGYVRLFVQVSPLLFLLQAAALAAFVERLPALSARRWAAAAGCVLAGALLVELAVRASHPRDFSASGSPDPANGKLIQDAPIHLSPVQK